MLYNYSISNLTGLQDLKIKNIDTLGNFLLINAEIERKPHRCPCCKTITDKVHDYRVQIIKDIPAFRKKARAFAQNFVKPSVLYSICI